jgi:hypothetical protein
VADPDQVAGAVATTLALEQPQGARLIEALVEVAAGGQDCEGCERTGEALNKAGFCPDCVAAAVAAGHAGRVGEGAAVTAGDAPGAPTVVMPAGVPPA